MRLGWVGAVLAATCWMGGPAWGQYDQSLTVSESDAVRLEGRAHFWHEKPARLGINEVASPANSSSFLPLAQETMFDLQPQNALWIRLDLDHKVSSSEHFVLWIPIPLIDKVNLYQPTEAGRWSIASAGDRVPVAQWPEPGRYPRFHLELPPGKTSLYLKIDGRTPFSMPIHIGSEIAAQGSDRQGFLGMGMVLGVLFTLVLFCFVTAYTYRDRLYLLYGMYMLLMVLAVASYTGLAAYVLWDRSPQWADSSNGVLTLMTAGAALSFLEAMLGGGRFTPRLSRAILTVAAACLPLAVLFYFLPRSAGVAILGVYMLVVGYVGLALSVQAWRQGVAVGKWVFLAYFPLFLAVLLAIARTYSWVSVSWVVQYGVIIALLIEAPTMMVALHVRSRERHEISTREQAMTTQDALTGLLKEHIFDDRLKQTMARSIKRREDAAVVLISLVNYEAIAQAYGAPVAEQSILRAVIKLRKVLRDVDTVARVGTSHFGLIMEGVGHRSRVTDIGARLIAQGLMPLPGLVPEVTLQFHLAAVLIRDIPAVQIDIKEELLAVLGAMSRRTRRPIRFWERTTTGGTPLTAIPPAPTRVDEMTAISQAASLKPPSPISSGSTGSPSSSSGWDSTSQGESSVPGGDTVAEQRSQM